MMAIACSGKSNKLVYLSIRKWEYRCSTSIFDVFYTGISYEKVSKKSHV